MLQLGFSSTKWSLLNQFEAVKVHLANTHTWPGALADQLSANAANSRSWATVDKFAFTKVEGSLQSLHTAIYIMDNMVNTALAKWKMKCNSFIYGK